MIRIFLLNMCICFGSHINCIDTACTSCSQGYLYNSTSCLSLCPTGFTELNSPNKCISQSSQNLFKLIFTEFLNYSAISIENFSHPSFLPFSSSDRLSPIPILYMGFYFEATSTLISTTSWIMGPDFTVSIMIKIITDGVIFHVNNLTSEYFQIISSSNSVSAKWLLQSGEIEEIYTITSGYVSGWNSFIIYSYQSTDIFTIVSNSNFYSYSNVEFRGQKNNLSYQFGGSAGTSFIGFIAQIVVDNAVITSYIMNQPFVNCLYNEYYNPISENCNSCPPSCTTWPWCSNNQVCSICYIKQCTICSGYEYNSCKICSSNSVPFCGNKGINCNGPVTPIFTCTKCPGNMLLLNGLCIAQPYNYNSGSLSTPVIDIKFSTFAGIFDSVFQCGHNSNTYYPYNSPESDDPYPVKNRGYYFDGKASFLVSTTHISLSYQNTIAIWTYSINQECAWSSNLYCLNGFLYATLYATNYLQALKVITNNYTDVSSEWVFMAFSMDFVSDSLTITQTINQASSLVLTVNGYAFYDDNQFVYIGKSQWANNYWNGFLFTLTVWQTAITDFSSVYNTCGTGLEGSCLWNCSVSTFYNEYTTSCMNCSLLALLDAEYEELVINACMRIVQHALIIIQVVQQLVQTIAWVAFI